MTRRPHSLSSILPAYGYRRLLIPFVVPAFYFAYMCVALLGNFVIAYSGISAIAAVFLIIFVVSLSTGISLGYGARVPKLRIAQLVTSRQCQVWGTLFAALSVGVLWANMIATYGSISYIFANAYAIRNAALYGLSEGGPVLAGYTSGLAYAMLAISLARFGHFAKWQDLVFAGAAFLLIVLTDLRLFGRNGIVFAIFCIAAFFVIYRVRLFSIRNVVLVVLLFVLLMAPRLIRGSFDNFSGTVDQMSWALRIPVPSSLNSLLSVYVYYFTSPYAFSGYLADGGIAAPLTLGFRTLTPVFRMVNRVIGLDFVSTIDAFTNIPFRFNVYTAVKDFYQDFGVLGVSLFPLIVGIAMGVLFRWKGEFNDALRILLLGWVFFSPLYNIFSFAPQMIGILVVFALSFVGMPASKLSTQPGRRQVRLVSAPGEK